MRVILEAIDLWKVYRSGSVEYPALLGVNLKVYESEFLALVGPSGSGKSTLLHILGGLDRPTRGRVLFEGRDLTGFSSKELAEYRSRKVGFVFQFYNLLPYLTALENVELSLAIAGVEKGARRRMALKALEAVGLADKANKRPSQLSGGEQQRVAIARAIATRPRVILADEPTGNLDSSTATSVVRQFRELVEKHNITVVMVTHNLELTSMCHRIARIKDGRIVEVKEAAGGGLA